MSRTDYASPDYTIALLPGAFDLPHYGYVNLFAQAMEIADVVIACIHKDNNVERIKGELPVMDLTERRSLIGAFRQVDYVIENYGDDDLRVVIEDVEPDFIMYGSDITEKTFLRNNSLSYNYLQKKGVELKRLQTIRTVTTKDLKKRICRK